MGYKITRYTLSTTNQVVARGDPKRKSIAFFNTDTSINMELTQGDSKSGFPIKALSSLSFDTLIDGSITTFPFQMVAESGTPVLSVLESYD